MEKIYRVQMNAKGMPNFATAQEVADRPQGEWIEQEDCWQCSECGDEYVLEVDVKPIDAKMYYCPNCGAKMADRKTEPTISKEEIISNAKLVGYQDGVKACNEEWLVRLGYKSQYDEPQGDILIPPHHTGFVQPIKQTERGE